MAWHMDLVEGFNIVITLGMLLLGLKIFITFRKADMELLKARMFLTKGLVKRMWVYSVLSGGFLVLYVLTRILLYLGYPGMQTLMPFAMALFLVPFTLLTKTWHHLIMSSVTKEPEREGFGVSPRSVSSGHSVSRP